jgi:hypothetical protein
MHPVEETKKNTVTAPSGAVIELKSFISGGDFLDASEAVNGVEPTKTQLAKKLMDLVVVSVNGVTTEVSAALRALPLADYLFLSKEVAKLMNFTEAKAQSQNQ